MAVKRLEKLHSLDIYYQKMRKDDLDSNQVVVDVAVVDALNECEPMEEASTSRSNYLEDSQEDSEEDVPDKRRRVEEVVTDTDRELRSKKSSSTSKNPKTEFPQIPVRNSVKVSGDFRTTSPE